MEKESTPRTHILVWTDSWAKLSSAAAVKLPTISGASERCVKWAWLKTIQEGQTYHVLVVSRWFPCNTVDGCEIHFAPPKKPWNDDSPVNTNKQMASTVVSKLSNGFGPSTARSIGKWVWVKFTPPQKKQVLVHASIFQSSILGIPYFCSQPNPPKTRNQRVTGSSCSHLCWPTQAALKHGLGEPAQPALEQDPRALWPPAFGSVFCCGYPFLVALKGNQKENWESAGSPKMAHPCPFLGPPKVAIVSVETTSRLELLKGNRVTV